jgi:serine phosphatase RsbU (regulator of sigma subunit)/anti-sigma regulatory factor (Ser/Thr protein kinase)/PAS domain-containing protein
MNVRALLSPAEVLDQIENAVLVSDPDGCLLYANSHAIALFGFPNDAGRLIGRSLVELGFNDSDERKISELIAQVMEGRIWEGTFATRKTDDSRSYVRGLAMPLRPEPGVISAVAIMGRKMSKLAQQRERDRIRLLERIGEGLSSSLELDVTLRQVAQILVPQFADHCVIDLFQGETLVRRAQLHAGGWMPPSGTWAMVGEQISYPEGHFCQQAMSRRDTVVVRDIRQRGIPAPTQASLETGRGVGMTSVLAAPLIARGELLGVVSLALSGLTERAELHYGADDGDFLSAVGSRIAIAIDNAMLFEEERRTALAFQNSLLPHDPPELDGLEVAYKYVPAKPLETHGQGIQTQVGGDWYDIIPLSAGRVGIVIGDVMGRGARAAAIMGQLRAALRAFAQDDKPPAEILHRLDDWCRTLAPPAESNGADPPIVSCTYLVYDAWSRTLSLANAGHDAPLLVTGAQVRQLEIEHKGVLLGVRGKGVPGLPTYREERRYLAPGSALVLYTDGLTDRRQRGDGEGRYTEAQALQMLCLAVRGASGGSVEAIAQAAERAVPGEIDDDMAIVVIRTSAEDLASTERVFPADPIRVSEARRLASETFESWGMDTAESDLACLLVSEVVTNVVLHAAVGRRPRGQVAERGEFTLRLRRGVAAVWVEVFDRDLRLPRLRSAGEHDEGGRGLYLVDQLATRWGSRPTQDGKAVWFEIPTRRGGWA